MRQGARSGYLGGRFCRSRDIMTNQISIWLGVILLGTVMLDFAMFGTEHMLFLGKKLFELLEWLAFWR
ncbi:hypothetical protein SPO2199 [Ruegeria pomeroyi DSS-3]|uniref:Glyceraldehyde-3-phosphate dehydrogenase n=2 Tax=Ruegeria pomeroyi TaxID=89184 RepID=Q5LRD0_RUEPO|nr:hypothetical protein SPO2199 [Ruegeria pomeroyi DSS-3]